MTGSREMTFAEELLAELVRRGIWGHQDARTPSEWLSWAVSLAPSTAREHIRVALRLRDFPEVTARFSRGECEPACAAIAVLDHQ